LEDLALPSVGASFKKWGRCTPILPKAQAHFPNFQKFIFYFLFNFKKIGTARQVQASTCGCGSRVDAWTCRAVPIFVEFFFLPALHFLRKWSTLSHWLQHMPALPKLLLETLNIHNF
jgi:hypothetical protein